MLTITCPKCNRSLSFNYASPGDVVMCRDCNLHLQSGTDGAVVLTDYQIDPENLLPREDDRLFDRCPNCHVTIFGGGLREGRLRFVDYTVWSIISTQTSVPIAWPKLPLKLRRPTAGQTALERTSSAGRPNAPSASP